MVDLEMLKGPFMPDRISWRVGSTTGDKSKGMALAYLDSRDVQDRLDAACGPENWQDKYAKLGDTTICEIGIRCGETWVWKSDGAGDTDFEAEKGALSSAFKRAAVKWGIGRYLYDIASPWVEIEAAGKSFKIKKSEEHKLYAALGGRAPARPTEPPQDLAPQAPKTDNPPPLAKSEPPSGKVLSPAEKRSAALAWGQKAVITARSFTKYEELDEWADASAKTIVKVREYDPVLHGKITEAIRERYALLSPAHSG